MSLDAKYADIDTRRALGFPPRKLNSEWKDFEPHPYGREIFKYFVNENISFFYCDDCIRYTPCFSPE